MHRLLRLLTRLALLAILLAAPGLALAQGKGPQQTIDGYTVTLALPEKGFSTGRNPVAVSLWDRRGNTPDATVTVGLIAFTPPGDGHGDTHNEATPAEGHAAVEADGHAAANSHEASATDSHEVAAAEEHGHDAANAIEGQGLTLAPVALAAGEELGEYQGDITFDEAGTYTVSVVFTVDGEERGAIFEVAVAQSRPRGLVLGGFALANALAVGAAGWLRWRGPRKLAARPARPAAATTTTPEE